MITTDFVTGSPCWLDLGAPDVAAAAAFYGGVLGWDFEPVERDAQGYGLFRSNGKTVAAAGPLTESGSRSAWVIYFRTPDADTAADTARRLGGTVRSGPTHVAGWGTTAQLTDPEGAEFAVFQPGEREGLERTDLPGSLCWAELYTPDVTGAKRFYADLFDWEYRDMPLPGDASGTYSLVRPSGTEEERMHGGLMRMESEFLALTGGRAYWHPVFAVADCDAAVAGVTERGGSVQMGPQDAKDVGRLAVCVDPAGADFVLLTPYAA